MVAAPARGGMLRAENIIVTLGVPQPVRRDSAARLPRPRLGRALAPAALAATLHVATELPGDPARAHAEGRGARDPLEAARAAVAGALGAGAAGVAFTSGGTEAVHLAVRGVAASRPGRIVSSAVEHTAVHAAADATGASTSWSASTASGGWTWTRWPRPCAAGRRW